MPKLLVALVMLALTAPTLFARPSLRWVQHDRPLAGGPNDLPLVEPHVAVNPRDASHVVVAAIAAAPDRTGPWHCSALTSFDAGASWLRRDLPVTRCIDPWVLFTPDGRLFVHLIEIRHDGEGDQRFELLQFTSVDGGRTWGDAVAFGRGFEHPIVVAGGNVLYRLVRRTVDTLDGPVHRLHLSRAAPPDWRFEDGREITASRAALNVTGIVPLTADRLLLSYRETEERPGNEGPLGMLPRARAFLLRVAGVEKPVSAPTRITEECSSGVEGAFPGYPTMTHAAQGALSGYLFHACVSPKLAGVTLVVSPDAGATWRPPVRVDLAAGAPAEDTRTPMVAVNDRGELAVAWYEGHHDPGRGRCQDTYVTVSTDAGMTFAPAVRVNTATSCPRTAGNGRVAQSWPMGGDYSSLAAAPDGTFVIVWADSRAERFALRSARFAVNAAPDGVQSPTETSYHRARALLARARAAIGSADSIAAAGGIAIDASGTLNKGAEYQGRTPQSLDPGPFREMLIVESAEGRAAYEYREERYDGTSESVREIYPGGDDRLIVLPETRQVITLRSAEHHASRRTLTRRVPQLLLDEVTRTPASLRWIGETGTEHHIIGALSSGEVVTLALDKRTGVLNRAESVLDVQGFGDTSVVWRFDDYAPLTGVGLSPRRYGVSVGGRPFTEMRITRIAPASADSFVPPPGYKPVGPVDAGADADASARAAVQELGPGIRRVTRLRQGFHPLFIEFADFVVALDAPAGYRLLNELPAGDVAPGPSSAWLSERYIDLIKRAVPGKPIRYVVVTHFHNDHLGGVRAFVAEGATVIAPPDTAAHVERLVAAPHTLAPDRLAATPRPLTLEVVRGTRTISDGIRRLDLIDVGDNPHGSEMLVAHLPTERLMFVSDLVEPVALERYPSPSHAALDRFFVHWLDAARLSPERVYTMHGAGLATPAHFDRLRQP